MKTVASWQIPLRYFGSGNNLDKIMATQCLKTIKTNDQAIARIQALNSDALGLLTELLVLLNRENEEEEVPNEWGTQWSLQSYSWVMPSRKCQLCAT